MAVTEVGTPTSGNSGSATDTSFVTTFPASPQAGDWAVIFGHMSGNSLTMSIDSSFTAITGWTNPFTQGTASRCYAWAKELSAGEAAPTITNSGSVTGGWECHLFRGASSVRGSRQGAAATSVALPTLTGCTAGSKLLTAVHARVASGTIPSGITPDAAYAESVDHATNRSTASANVRMETSTRDVSTGGDYGGETFTVTNAISSSMVGGLVEVLADASTVSGAAAGAVGVAGAAAGTRAVLGAAAGSAAVAGSAAGTRGTSGGATGTVAISAAATGTRKVAGSGAGSLAVAGTVAGTRKVLGAATGTVAVAGTATGLVPSGNVTGSAFGVVAVTGTSSGVRASHGSAAGSVVFAGSASGTRTVLAAGAGAVTLAGVATGRRTVLGAAIGSVVLASTAVGRRATSGSGSAVLAIVGTASGSVPDAVVERPNTGTTARPSTGTVIRPNTGLVLRP